MKPFTMQMHRIHQNHRNHPGQHEKREKKTLVLFIIRKIIYLFGRYQSKWLPDILKAIDEKKDYHRTMGYACVELDSPENFLKIGCGIRADPVPKDHACPHRYLAPVPRTNQTNQTKRARSAPSPNFKLQNIRSVVKAQPKRPSARYVDTRKGDFHNVHGSGLLPTYIYQPKFGTVPNYILRRADEIKAEDEMARLEEMRRQPICRFITHDERQEILDGLRKNWQELQRTFQGLSVITDTVPKKLRKIKIETQLKQLEKDILLVESNPYIYVYEHSEKKTNGK